LGQTEDDAGKTAKEAILGVPPRTQDFKKHNQAGKIQGTSKRIKATILRKSSSSAAEDMRPGVDTALRTCQGAAVNRVKRLGGGLPSPAPPPGVAVSQLPCLGLPLVLRTRLVETEANKQIDSKL
jgi:hypothetical protein